MVDRSDGAIAGAGERAAGLAAEEREQPQVVVGELAPPRLFKSSITPSTRPSAAMGAAQRVVVR